LASVSVDDVRDVINVSSAEVPDAKVLKMIKRAEVTFLLNNEVRNFIHERDFQLQLSSIHWLIHLSFSLILDSKQQDNEAHL